MPRKNELGAHVAVEASNYDAAEAARRLKQAIRGIGTIQDAADRSGVPKGTLNQYLRGGEMKLSNALALAKAAGVSLDWLATGEGPMRPGAPQKSAASTRFSMRESADLVTLEAAYSSAVAALAAAGKDTQHPPSIARLIAILYDELRDGKYTSTNS